ncbi:unnamed protein product [Acanthosepion pharaonis]|uniref:Uncharacterized protein n=1 Tax=Acanthosepion pharaonis TaxID=158019 RepID=A0A812DZL9_ACAPH|nr:unnamed protein product [Sepia pharaonis]
MLLSSTSSFLPCYSPAYSPPPSSNPLHSALLFIRLLSSTLQSFFINPLHFLLAIRPLLSSTPFSSFCLAVMLHFISSFCLAIRPLTPPRYLILLFIPLLSCFHSALLFTYSPPRFSILFILPPYSPPLSNPLHLPCNSLILSSFCLAIRPAYSPSTISNPLHSALLFARLLSSRYLILFILPCYSFGLPPPRHPLHSAFILPLHHISSSFCLYSPFLLHAIYILHSAFAIARLLSTLSNPLHSALLFARRLPPPLSSNLFIWPLRLPFSSTLSNPLHSALLLFARLLSSHSNPSSISALPIRLTHLYLILFILPCYSPAYSPRHLILFILPYYSPFSPLSILPFLPFLFHFTLPCAFARLPLSTPSNALHSGLTIRPHFLHAI